MPAEGMSEPTSLPPVPDGLLRFLFSTPPLTGSSPAIFLDRDGVINERILGGYVTRWSAFKFSPGIQRAMADLSSLAPPLIVVSNQAGVGKGLMTPAELAEITRQFVTELRNYGARVDAVYYCTHKPEEHCSCRKPAPGLLLQAAQDWRIDLQSSILIGDSPTDLRAAKATRCRTILFGPQDPENTLASQFEQPDLTVHDPAGLPAAVRRLLALPN